MLDGNVAWTAEFDLTPEQAAALLGDGSSPSRSNLRGYRGVGDNFLWIGKLGGAVRVTLFAPEYTMRQDITVATLMAWIDGGWINMDAATLADLRKWALGEVAA